MATLSDWIDGARPRTLPAAVAPVAVGTGAAVLHGADGAASAHGTPAWAGAALLALVVSLTLQVGVNYANDYSDGIRGTDDDRVGPVRLTASGLAAPAEVKRAAFAAFGVAAVAGLALVVVSGAWWLLGVGAAAIAAAWYYTGGSRPYGYAGLGEVFVFVFFGLVAVLGTTWTQVGTLTGPAWAGAVGVGANACALLVVNNLRDIPTDAVSGKRTLAVRLGDRATRLLFAGLLAAAAACAVVVAVLGHPRALVALLAAVPGVRAVSTVARGARGPALVAALRDTGRVALVYGLLLGAGLAASA